MAGWPDSILVAMVKYFWFLHGVNISIRVNYLKD